MYSAIIQSTVICSSTSPLHVNYEDCRGLFSKALLSEASENGDLPFTVHSVCSYYQKSTFSSFSCAIKPLVVDVSCLCISFGT